MVMLGEPRLVEAQPLGELDLFKQLVEGLTLRHPRPCLIVTECPKPHACSSRKLDLTLARLPRKPNRSDARKGRQEKDDSELCFLGVLAQSKESIVQRIQRAFYVPLRPLERQDKPGRSNILKGGYLVGCPFDK